MRCRSPHHRVAWGHDDDGDAETRHGTPNGRAVTPTGGRITTTVGRTTISADSSPVRITISTARARFFGMGRETTGRVTILDVAHAAGVKPSTVSKALNDGRGSADVRRRVAEAASRLGYRPNQQARGLRRSESRSIGVLIPDLANPVFLPFLRGVEHAAQERGYVVLITDGQRSHDPTIDRARALLRPGGRRARARRPGRRREPAAVPRPRRTDRADRSPTAVRTCPGTGAAARPRRPRRWVDG